jgi:hypothetical protein
MKKVKRNVIEQKEEFKSKNAFSIEHSEHESNTITPSIIKDETNSIIYVDLAGLNEKSNEFIEFINTFIDRYIFLKSEKIRFLLPINYEKISNRQWAAFKN